MSAMTTEADYWITQQNMGQWRTARKVGSCTNRYRVENEPKLVHCRNKWHPGERYLDTGFQDDLSASPFATLRYCRECAVREVS